MKNKSVILAVLAVVIVLLAVFLIKEDKPAKAKAAIGQAAPNFELSDIQGNKVSLSDFRGKVALVNFWATWCDTCRQEAPALHVFANDRELAGGLEVVKILFRDSMSNAGRYLKENNFNFRVLLDDRQASLDYGVRAVPESFIISKKGILRHKFIGPVNWDSPDLKTAVKNLISEE
jgi:cytochrome c biogenesis protein CcmG, thiol:disulfide interchange protein DsbE